VALALLDSLDETGLALLASRLAPHLQSLLDQAPAEEGDEWMDSRRAAQYLGISR
jgi:hypothetical protein